MANEDSFEVVSAPDNDGYVHVKTGEVDLSQPGVLGVIFSDPKDSTTIYEITNIGSSEPITADHVEADLVEVDTEYDVRATKRIRLHRHLREADTVSWVDADNRKTMKRIGGATVAATTLAFVGVMTLYKIRRDRGQE